MCKSGIGGCEVSVGGEIFHAGIVQASQLFRGHTMTAGVGFGGGVGDGVVW